MFEGHVESDKRLNLLNDDVDRHYHVITNLTGAMAKKYVCKACNKSCRSDAAHNCDQTCSKCMTSPPCDSKVFEFLVTNAIDTLEVRIVSIITRGV